MFAPSRRAVIALLGPRTCSISSPALVLGHCVAAAGGRALVPGLRRFTRVSYTTDVRTFADWCHPNQLTLLGVRRVDLDLFARWMEADGRMRSTVARRLASLASLASFYRYCHAEGIVARGPRHQRSPTVGRP